MKDNYGLVQELVAYADKYKAEKDADGNLVRDAKEVDEIVTEAKVEAYKDSNVAWAGLEAAKKAIENATIASGAKGLSYAKENAKALLAEYADNDYYPAEQAKIDEIIAEFNAKVEAATKTDEIKKAGSGLYDLYKVKVNAVRTEDMVDTLLKAKTAYKDAKTSIKNYVDYYNGALSAAEAGKKLDFAAADALLCELYGEGGARTEAEITAMKDSVAGLVQKLPTAEAQAAAKKAAVDAINAIPAVVTLADEAAVQAAVDAVDAYEDLCGTELPSASATALNNAKAALGTAYKADLYKKYSTLNKTDKAAVKALIAEFNAAAEKTCVDGIDVDTDKIYEALEDALDAIRTTEKNAVIKAINTIPVNVTEADKAAVVAAREAYDAYVNEYTTYGCDAWGVDGTLNCNAVLDITNFRELALAEATLGLNTEDPALSVESLKLTASSTAAKGSITVKWKVVGDTSAVEGYEIWKSTKRSSGFSKAFTQKATKKTYKNTKGLKKGTRYYYKVRAIAYTADGTKVKSDWSNKAYRIAK